MRFECRRPVMSLLCLFVGTLCGPSAMAYITVPVQTFGLQCTWSKYITVVRVEAVDHEKGVIVFRKVRDLKGIYPKTTIRHVFEPKKESNPVTSQPIVAAQGLFRPDVTDWRYAVRWAATGKLIVMFSFDYGGAGDYGHAYVDGCWYAMNCPQRDWENWYTIYTDPNCLIRWYCGTPDQLIDAVEAVLAGKEVAVPVLFEGSKEDLRGGRAKIKGLKVSLAIRDYAPQRDLVNMPFNFRRFLPTSGMPGFTHYKELATMGPGAVGVTPGDFMGDGRPGLCLYDEQRVVLFENTDDFRKASFCIEGGAHSAAWADCNGDGRLDMLLATPFGLRLFANQGNSKFIEATNSLSISSYQHVTAAAWITITGAKDARPDILAADGFRGLRLYRNTTAQTNAPAATNLPAVMPHFVDVSDTVGLGSGGIAGNLKGDHLAVADVNGDGRPDVLYSAGNGALLLNTTEGFRAATNSGISYQAGGVAPAFGDFNGDGLPDLFVPQRKGGLGRLFINKGRGRFQDVTGSSGALAEASGQGTCAVWSDFCGRGKQDLLVGCVYGPNRYFRNSGSGTFSDAGNEIGLYKDIYNSSGMCVVDANMDGVPDLVLGNRGRESVVLVGNRSRLASTNQSSAASGMERRLPQ